MTSPTAMNEPIYYEDAKGIHACEGATVHPGIFLVWTRCERDVPANKGFRTSLPISVTCPRCLDDIAKYKEHSTVAPGVAESSVEKDAARKEAK